jgi:hypothetical protein
MSRKTLLDILTGDLAYDSSWAVYAERIDGEFRPESPARIGQRRFESGGWLDEYYFFASNKRILDFVETCFEGRDPETITDVDRREVALELIDNMNALAVD